MYRGTAPAGFMAGECGVDEPVGLRRHVTHVVDLRSARLLMPDLW
jgi:hypothetical protein